MIKMCIGQHGNYRYSCHTLVKFDFSTDFSKNSQISNFMKTRAVGAELFHTDGRAGRQTDRHMAKLIAAFLNFGNAPKMLFVLRYRVPTPFALSSNHKPTNHPL